MSARQELIELWASEACSVFQYIAPDIQQGYAEMGERLPTGRKEKAFIAEMCLDADRMNPEWSGSCLGDYTKITPEVYKHLLAMWHDPKGRKEMIAAIDFGF